MRTNFSFRPLALIALLFLAIGGHPGTALGQPFAKSYREAGMGLEAGFVKLLADGDLLLAGNKSPTYGNQDLVFMKVNPANGDTVWARSYASGGLVLGNVVVEEMGNGSLIATCVASTSGSLIDTTKMLVFATDSSGNMLWSKYYMQPVNYFEFLRPMVKKVSPSEFLMFYTSSDTIGAVITKMDTAGDTLFSKAINIDSTYNGNDFQFSDAVNVGDGYLLEGFVRYSEFEDHVLLVKTDTLGNLQWVRSDFHPTTFAVAGYSLFGNDAILTADSNIVIGVTGNGLGLLKTNRTGTPIWLKLYNDTASYTTSPGYARMTATNDGGFLISGITDEPSNNANALSPVGRQLLTKFDSGGNVQWARTYAMDKDFNICTFAAQLANGTYACAGTMSDTIVSTTVNNSKLYVMLLDSTGHSAGATCGTDSAYSYFSATNALTMYDVPRHSYPGFGVAALPVAAARDTPVSANVGLVKAVALIDESSSSCEGTPVVFAAVGSNAGAGASYDFLVNGTSVQLGASNVFITSTLGYPDTVTCTMWGSSTCGTADTVVSNPIVPLVYPSGMPIVVVHASPGDTVAAGTTVTFTVSVTNGGPTPTYSWTKNFVFETSLPAYTTSSVANGDLIECNVTNNTLCSSTPTGMGNMVIFVTPLSVSGVAPGTGINLVPNPASSLVFLTGSISGEVSVAVHDILGRTMPATLQGNRSLDVSTWPSGIYVVEVLSGGQDATFRLQVGQ